jgi:WD40 repeat protein
VGKPLDHSGRVNCVAFSPHATHIAAAIEDASIYIWITLTGEAVGTPLRSDQTYINAIAFSPENSHIASGATDGTIIIWHISTGNAARKIPSSAYLSSENFLFSADNAWLAFSYLPK